MKYHGHIMDRGTTSACAENTASRIPKYHMTWNYLRVRGEYQGHGILPGRWGNYLRVRGEYPKQCHKERLIRELPPRARRIRALVA